MRHAGRGSGRGAGLRLIPSSVDMSFLARDSARLAFDNAARSINARLRSLTFDESFALFQARPAGSKIKIGLEPLYGPPPAE